MTPPRTSATVPPTPIERSEIIATPSRAPSTSPSPSSAPSPPPLTVPERGGLHPRRLAALAAACLTIDDARLYGLIEGGPEIDRGRCTSILGELKAEGIVPDDDEVSAAALSVLAELGAVRQ